MAARAGGDKIPIDDDVLIDVFGAHIAGVAEQIIMDHNPAASDQLGSRRCQPHAMTDDAF